MGKLNTPADMSREQQEAAAHVTPVHESEGKAPVEKQRSDTKEQVDIEHELEKQDQYPG